MSKLKLALKLVIATALFVGVCSILPAGNGKAAADTNGSQCPQPNEIYNSNVPTNGSGVSLWGYQGGESVNNFGGIIVRAHISNWNGDPSGGPGNIGKSTDVGYVLNSYLPPADPGDSYNLPAGDVPNSRIFQLTNTGTQTTVTRTSSHTFNTGETLYDNESPSNPGSPTGGGDPFSCTGWSALGPGTPGEAGDNWGMDCGEFEYKGGNPNKPDQNIKTRFWINGLNNSYGGTTGVWEIQIDGTTYTQDANGNPMNPGGNYFTIPNGTSTRVDLIWHPNKPVHHPPDLTSECYGIDVTDGGGAHINSKYFDSSDVRTLVNVQDSSGRVLVDGSTGGVSGSTGGAPNGSSWGILQDTELNHKYEVQPNGKVVHVYVFRQYYHNTGNKDSNGNWIYEWDNIPDGSTTDSGAPISGNESRDHNCYAASCTVTEVDGNVPGGPGNGVLAGSNFNVVVWVNNSGDDTYLPLNSPTVNGAGVDGDYLPLDPGDSGPAYLTVTAANAVENQTLTFTVADSEVHDEGTGLATCSTSVPVYGQFSASVSSYSNLTPTSEHPNTASYGASISHQWVNAPGGMPPHSINNPTYVAFYEKLASGGTAYPCAPSSDEKTGFTVPSPNPPGSEGVWAHNCALADNSYSAGDEYCSAVSATYSGGYVGPDSNVVGGVGPASTNPSCPRVVNEPYFKVYNSGATAGGDFNQCTTNGGLLAGYADVSDPAGATRGSSTELSALALIKITGVASAQSVRGRNPQNINRPPTNLTFANSGVEVDPVGNESPILGGNYGDSIAGSGCQALTDETPPQTAVAAKDTSPTPVIANVAGLTPPSANAVNAHMYDDGRGDTKLVIGGGTLSTDQNVSVFVNGDAYIAGNINFAQTTGWTSGSGSTFQEHAPSFVLHATGNVYISPNVTSLAGIYIAEQSSPSASNGKIYTCASGFAAMPQTALYSSCKNQLTVYGSFVADQVNLMRTFGSLRDEEPNPAHGPIAGGPAYSVQWSSCGSYGHPVGGESCLPASGQAGLRCTTTDETSEDPVSVWADNVLCVPNTSGLALAWTHYDNNPGTIGDWTNPASGWAPQWVLNNDGYKYCTSWNVPTESGDHTWYDNELCMNIARSDNTALLHFVNSATAPAGESCIPITEIGDPDSQWLGGHWLCQPIVGGASASPPTPTGPPFTACSNRGSQTDSNACASEIFEFTPGLYMANPSDSAPSGGSLQLQSITSLPPVL